LKDCDAKFGVLWKATLRQPGILTPQEYENLVRSCLGKIRNIEVDVIDIYICPDYIYLMNDCIDHEIKHVWKKENTKLQWIMEAVQRDMNHRQGVHTEYRSYAQDQVCEIIDIDPSLTPQYTTDFRVQIGEVANQPTSDDPNEYIGFLTKFPTREIRPVGIYRNSSDWFERKTFKEIEDYFQERQNSVIVSEWQRFAENLPKSDNVREYMDEIKQSSFVPLRNELFGPFIKDDLTTEINPTISKTRTKYGDIDFEQFDGEPIRRVRFTASAPHRGYDKTNVPQREVISDPAAAKTPEEAYSMLLEKIFSFTVDSLTADGFKSYLDKANISYAKSWKKRQLLET